MATRALIGLLKQDGKVVVVHSHSDGYPEYLGAILNKYYLTINKVKQLLKMGDVSMYQYAY